MFIAFTLEAVAVFALLQLISRPVWFIALSGLCFFAWGEIFSLFPSITGDLFGKTWATTNYGIVYTAKGAGAFFAGVGAAWLFEKTGSWNKVGDDCLRSYRRILGSVLAEARRQPHHRRIGKRTARRRDPCSGRRDARCGVVHFLLRCNPKGSLSRERGPFLFENVRTEISDGSRSPTFAVRG
jgi:hypothetical protein